MTLSRRSFFTGLATLITAPAIVRAESLMKLAPTEIIKPSLRFIETYNPVDQTIRRLDVLYGYTQVRSEWSVYTLDEYSERILAPMVNSLAQQVADAVMHRQAISKYDLAEIHSIPLSKLLVEAREGHQFA